MRARALRYVREPWENILDEWDECRRLCSLGVPSDFDEGAAERGTMLR
jgi:hypothetical protein